MPAWGITQPYLAHNLVVPKLFSIALLLILATCVRKIDQKRALSVKLLFFDCCYWPTMEKFVGKPALFTNASRTQQSALLVIRKHRDNN